jgi:hypothetical protein
VHQASTSIIDYKVTSLMVTCGCNACYPKAMQLKGGQAAMQERDFKAEIEAARNDPAQLRKIADVQAAGVASSCDLRSACQGCRHGSSSTWQSKAELLASANRSTVYRYKLAPGMPSAW